MTELQNFPRGSEWRKWDLHVHTPGTKLSNGYSISEMDESDSIRVNELYEKCKDIFDRITICNKPVTFNEQRAKEWLLWIDIVQKSKIKVVGVTDYYSLDNFL